MVDAHAAAQAGGHPGFSYQKQPPSHLLKTVIITPGLWLRPCTALQAALLHSAADLFMNSRVRPVDTEAPA